MTQLGIAGGQPTGVRAGARLASGMRSVAAFARNDLRGVFREPLLAGVIFAPVVWTLMVRFGTPAATSMVADRFDFDLRPYYPLILTSFLLLTSPLISGMLAAFLLLEERDTGTLTAVAVTPASMGSYLVYRFGMATIVGALYVVGTFTGSGLLTAAMVPGMLVAAVVSGLCSIPIGLTMLVLARNKVEGIAVARAMGILVAGLPILPYFLAPPWRWLFGVLPPYWPSEIVWMSAEGRTWWPFVVGGLVTVVIYSVLLGRRFLRGVR